MAPEKESTIAQSVIEALLDDSRLFPARHLLFFSDMTRDDLSQIVDVWPRVSVARKISLLSDLETMMEADSLLSCDALAKFALDDEDPQVRSRAISLLWECEDHKLVPVFNEKLDKDPSELVQVTAAAGLGRFVLMGELDEIPESAGRQAIALLKKKLAEKPPRDIQQEIMKSLAYTGGAQVSGLIDKAYAENDATWRLAAVIAMGRTADERWEKPVLDAIQDDSLPFQIEAVKAAGELELESARLPLLEMVEDEISDLELRLQTIWALSRIGGEDVREALQDLLESAEDEEEIEVLELALEHLDFSEELPDLDL